MRKYQQVYIGKEEFKRFCIVKSSTLNDAQSIDGLKELKINGNASWSGSDMEQELSLCHSVVDLEHNGNLEEKKGSIEFQLRTFSTSGVIFSLKKYKIIQYTNKIVKLFTN